MKTVALAGQQGQDQKHHERAVQSRNPLGVDQSNPITDVRQSSKRQNPDVLTPEEIAAILKHLADPLRTDDRTGCLYGTAAGRTHRARWEDVDFESLVMNVRSSVVAMVEGVPKTEASHKDVPLGCRSSPNHCPSGSTIPLHWTRDWVFASPHKKGHQPYWPGTLWRYYGTPAVNRAEVKKHVSYHTFRHTFGTLMNANGENAKVMQEFLRHASMKVTTDVYMQAVIPRNAKRRANW